MAKKDRDDRRKERTAKRRSRRVRGESQRRRDFDTFWDKRGREFGEEVSDAAENFGERIGAAFDEAFGGSREDRMELRNRMKSRMKDEFGDGGDYAEWRGRRHWHRFELFGGLGPLFGSIVGLLFVALAVIALNLVNAPLQSTFLFSVSAFVVSHLPWIFGIFLFFGYSDYLSRKFDHFWVVAPFFKAGGIVIMLWIAVWALGIIGSFGGSDFLLSFSSAIWVNVGEIFFLLVLLGYVVEFWIMAYGSDYERRK